MQAYNDQFAKVYNLRWGEFAERAAPLIRDFYQDTPICQMNRSLLDICCGSGQLVVKFLKWDYRVVGIDLFEPDGYFIFDLNTRAGLKKWNKV